MKFTVADLLDQIPSDRAVAVSRLEKALGLSQKEQKQQLRIGLDALCRLGVLSEDSDGLQRQGDQGLIEARLRCSSKGFCFALREDGGEDIYIRDHQLNHAWNGDRVLVRITREGARRRSPEGGVVCILERQTTHLLAQIQQQDERLVAVPLDDRLLTGIELPPGDASHLAKADASVVEVCVDRFPVGQFAPQGHVERSLPVAGGPKADLDLLLTRHGLHQRPAPPRLAAKAPAAKDRDDLTGLATLLPRLWQGDGAPPLPALSLEPLEDGTRLWVHAPTLAERLGLGTSLDLWLREQGESFCLGDRWLPLLPPALARAAQFSAGEANAALSVALDIGKDGDLRGFRFCRSRIQPDAVVDAAALQALAERKPKARTLPAALKPLKDQLPLLEQLLELTALLRQRRLAAGSTDLDLPLPALKGLGDLAVPAPDGQLQGWLSQLNPHEPAGLLREAVLVAHRALGHHLASLQLPGLFDANASADGAAVNEVAKAALALEIPLELSAEGNASPAELAAAFAASDRSRPLQLQLRSCFEPVQLATEAAPHALAGEPLALAPWCCPALHYADLWNQQLLTLLLAEGKDRPNVRHRSGVDLGSSSCHGQVEWSPLTGGQLEPFQEARQQRLAARLQNRRRLADELGADRLSLAQARAAEAVIGQVQQGVISGIQSYGFFVEVPPSMVEGLVHVSSLKDDWYEFRARQNRLVGRKNRRTYKLGDPVEVLIEKVDGLRNQIDLAVVLPEAEDDTAAAGSEPSPGGDGD